jgi:O-methyltransferase involved in polyketide biosynthesis
VSDDPSSSGLSRTAIDTSIAHPARIWNYWLGGKDNFEVDREIGERLIAILPELVHSVRADRQFLARAVEYLAGAAGIRQFLDIGTGLPTADNTHQIAQRVAAESRIVYVDNDPLVLSHARALLTSTPDGACDYIHADVHEPGTILAGAAATLDFAQPVAIMMLGILNFVLDADEVQAIVHQLLDSVPSGSYLVISHPTTEVDAEAATRLQQVWNRQGAAPMRTRTREEVVRFFDGLDLVEPGVVSCSRWRPGQPEASEIAEVAHFCGVARKP